MHKIKSIIHKSEEKDILELQRKLIKSGFKLNTKFQTTIVPLQGTLIRKTYVEDYIIYEQEET